MPVLGETGVQIDRRECTLTPPTPAGSQRLAPAIRLAKTVAGCPMPARRAFESAAKMGIPRETHYDRHITSSRPFAPIMRRETYIYRAALAMYLLGGVGACTMLLLHWLIASQHWPAPVVPLLIAILSWWFAALLIRWPNKLVVIARTSVWLVVFIHSGVLWQLLRQHHSDNSGAWLASLPPAEIVLFPIMMFAVVLLPRREGRVTAFLAWLAVTLPILMRFISHPADLQTSRGLELLVALGPVSGCILVLIPLFRGIERHVQTLEGERRRMQELAERDALTGLYNRRAGEAWIQDAITARKPGVGLILFDVDRFKQINDQYGHDAGDEVLKAVAQRCSSAIREDDVLMRWGGEEFLVLLRGVDRATLAVIAESLRTVCRRQPVDRVGTVTASFGATLWRANEAIEETLKRADAAMYAAKTAGRDRVVVT